MNNPTLLYIPDLNANEFHWYDGLSSHIDTLETIARKLDQDVILILSGTQTYLTKIDLPNISAGQIQKAAPFALEDELTEDIEALHFAYAPLIKNQPVAIAVINKLALKNFLVRLQEQGIDAKACYIASLLLPNAENHYNIAIYNHQALIKTSSTSGFTIPSDQLETFLQFQLQAETNLPEFIFLENFDSKEKFNINLPGISIQQTDKATSEFSPMLAAQIAKNQIGINLFQGEFKAKQKSNPIKQAWMIAGIVFASWIALTVLGDIASYFYYNHQSAKLTQQIDALYMQVFPDATQIVSPKLRIERELKKYQQGGGDGGFLTLLEKIAPVLNNTITLENLSYQQQHLILDIQTDSFETLQKFVSELKDAALKVQQTNAKNQGKFVIAELSISLTQAEST